MDFWVVFPSVLGGLLLGYFIACGVMGGTVDRTIEDLKHRIRMKELDIENLRDELHHKTSKANYWHDMFLHLQMSAGPRQPNPGHSGYNFYNTGHGPTQPPPRQKAKATPPPKYPKTHWRMVLGVGDGKVTKKEVNARFVVLAMRYHPDKGGDTAKMAAINAARDQALNEL